MSLNFLNVTLAVKFELFKKGICCSTHDLQAHVIIYIYCTRILELAALQCNRYQSNKGHFEELFIFKSN